MLDGVECWLAHLPTSWVSMSKMSVNSTKIEIVHVDNSLFTIAERENAKIR